MDEIGIDGDTFTASVDWLSDLLEPTRRATAARQFLYVVDGLGIPEQDALGRMMMGDPEYAHLTGEAHHRAAMAKYAAAYHFRVLEEQMEEFLREAAEAEKSRRGIRPLYPFVGMLVVGGAVVVIGARVLWWALRAIGLFR